MKPSPPAAQVNRDVAEYKNKSKIWENIANPFSFDYLIPRGGNKRISLLSIAKISLFADDVL